MPTILTSRFQDALNLAFELHQNQIRKGSGVPYMAHLMGVASLVLEDGGNEDEAIAGLLHDAVEDQGGVATLEQIRVRFGEPVAAIVQGCTDADTLPKPPWRARKEAYLMHLRTAPPAVRRVSSADKLYNARAILADYRVVGDALWGRFTGGKEGSLWYYRSLVTIFQECGTTPMVAELDRVVTELETMAATKTLHHY